MSHALLLCICASILPILHQLSGSNPTWEHRIGSNQNQQLLTQLACDGSERQSAKVRPLTICCASKEGPLQQFFLCTCLSRDSFGSPVQAVRDLESELLLQELSTIMSMVGHAPSTALDASFWTLQQWMHELFPVACWTCFLTLRTPRDWLAAVM